MTTQKNSRRSLLAGFAVLLGGSALAGKVAAAVPTPRAAEGPFYPRPSMRMPDIDNNLVRIAGLVEEAGGEIFTLRGTVSDGNGRPLAHHRIEIWQCDMNGKYLHPGDNRNVEYDKAFQGFGHDITDENGGYVFRTIKPVVYPGRAPHIHVKVVDGNRELLTTQFYVRGNANNARDFLFNRMSETEAEAVSMDFVETETGPEATINVVI